MQQYMCVNACVQALTLGVYFRSICISPCKTCDWLYSRSPKLRSDLSPLTTTEDRAPLVTHSSDWSRESMPICSRTRGIGLSTVNCIPLSVVPCGLALEIVGMPSEVCTVLKCGVSSSLTSEPCSIRIPLPLPSESSLGCKSLQMTFALWWLCICTEGKNVHSVERWRENCCTICIWGRV